MIKYYLTICLLLFLVQTGIAQSENSLKGKVVTQNGIGIEDANVELQGTSLGTLTNASGEYKFSKIPQGDFILKVSFVGFKSKEILISVRDEKLITVPNITLELAEENLEEVVVTGISPNPFSRNNSSYIAKLPIANIENPQVYNSITAELLEQQVVTNFDDAIKNAPGLVKLWESTGRGNDGAGYFSLRGFPVQPTLINGLPALTNVLS